MGREVRETPDGGWQVWETVSEGSPITPAFVTKEKLVDHLVTVGDDWGKKDGRRYSRAAAERLVDTGWAPSMVMRGGRILRPEEMDDL